MVSRRTSEDRLNRPKTVYFRLPASTYAYIRPLSREERRKSAAERPKASSLKPGSPIFGLSRPNNERRSLTCAREAGLYRAFAGALPCTCGYLCELSHTCAPKTCRSHEERPRIVPPPWSIGRDSIGSKKGGDWRRFRTTIGQIKKLIDRGQSGPDRADWKKTILGEMTP